MKTTVFRGLKINIENEAGSVRSGIDRITGKPWSTKMPYDYGEIVDTKGVDGDPVDVFIGPDKSAAFVYVIHQLNKNTGAWDEDKCFLGFDDEMDAKAAYYKAYDNPDLFYGSIESIPIAVFKQRVKSNNGATMIHASVGVGDGVTVDGLPGRGVVVAEDGSDVVVKYRSGVYLKRNKMYVHNLGDNMYHNRYMSAEVAPKPKGSGKKPHKIGIAGPKGINPNMGQPQGLKAGGPGSGRHKGSDKTKSVDKGLNKWKSWDKEIKQAHSDPKQRKLPFKAAELINSPELNVVTTPRGPMKRIKKVGTTFCVVSTGTDKNFGCYNSKEQAQAVIDGKSFITPNVPDNLLAYGYYSRGAVIGHKIKEHGMKIGHRRPNMSRHGHKGIGHRIPNIRTPRFYAFGDLGEPMAGAMGHAHMEPEMWFHPPSEKRPKRIPVDDPQEKDDRFLDVTKRKQAKKDRMARLKRSAPGGLPALIPAHTTLLAPHTAVYQPGMFGSAKEIKARRTKDERMRVAFNRQGCI